MSFPINYVMCVICISKKLTKQGNQKLKDNLLCYFKCSFKKDKLDFRVQFSSILELSSEKHEEILHC